MDHRAAVIAGVVIVGDVAAPSVAAYCSRGPGSSVSSDDLPPGRSRAPSRAVMAGLDDCRFQIAMDDALLVRGLRARRRPVAAI
jgi:hypothetical protein